MKKYKEKIIHIGGSDISQLLIRTPNKADLLEMGSDGDYKAYVVFNRDLIPNYYAKKLEYFKPYWFEIIDDDEIVFDSNYEFNESNIDKLEVYRAGDFGIIFFIKFNSDFKFGNSGTYYYIDNNSIKIQLVKKIEGSKESLKHIKITFEEEKNEKNN